MANRTDVPATRRPRAIRTRLFLSLGLLLGLGSVGTLASWTATSTSPVGAIDSGNLDVTIDGELAGEANRNGTKIYADWKVEDMLPGETYAYQFTVGNGSSGRAEVDVRVDAFTLQALGPGLRFQFFEGTATNEPLAPGFNNDRRNISAQTFRKGSCSGPQLTAGWTSFGPSQAAATNFMAGNEVRLSPGDSVTFCAVVKVDESAAGSSTYLGTYGTVFFVANGTQVNPS